MAQSSPEAEATRKASVLEQAFAPVSSAAVKVLLRSAVVSRDCVQGHGTDEVRCHSDPFGSYRSLERGLTWEAQIVEKCTMRLAAALLVAVLALTVTASALAHRKPAGAPLPANPAAPRLLGVSVPWSSSWVADLDAYSSRVGRVPSVVSTYRDLEGALLDTAAMTAVASRGAVPMVTVEPWDSSSSTDPRYALKNIVRGDFDAWFEAGADAAHAFGKPFYLRFAPEMNGVWAPWEAGVNGNTPEDYVAAWRHVHALFVGRGAGNVRWVWGPNVFGGGSAVDFTPYYPGSDVVDVLALDGYNWGSLGSWQTYSQVFGPSYDTLAKLDPVKPVMIAETASTESGGDKAAWITSAFTREIAARTPRVKTVVWFDVNKETDWRVESSNRSLNAYRAVATSSAWG
jgi:Glycosyl hydrolase family 26